jgi:16S rRNA (guanine(966)-N(2))-methyltransferase RsmD
MQWPARGLRPAQGSDAGGRWDVSDVADAGRVIAGTARGVRLAAPGEVTRPLGDRVKQTLFAVLDPDLPGAAFLDLFAGSGSAGIEALSRGARHATFVERDAAAVKVIAANLARARVADRATVVRADVLAWLRGPALRDPGVPASSDERQGFGPFAVAVVDPPYGQPDVLVAALDTLGPLLAPGARVVAKHFWRDRPPTLVGLLASERERRFGETALTFYRLQEDR